jgi:hypothetical protein
VAIYTIESEPFPAEGPTFDADRLSAATATEERLYSEFISKFSEECNFVFVLWSEARPDGMLVLCVTAIVDCDLPK